MLVAPLAIVLIMILIVPLFFLVWTSFYTYDPLLFVTHKLTLENYIHFFTKPVYYRVVWNTILFATVITFLTFVLGFPLAYWLSRHVVKRRELFLGMVILPIALTDAVQGFGWTAILGQSGVINRTLLFLGIVEKPLKLMYNTPAVILVLTQILVPYMVLSLLSVITKINRNLEESAANLGAPFHIVIWKIVLPLSMPGILAGSIFVWLGAATAFVIPRIIGGGQIQVLGTMVYQQVQQVVNYPFAAVVSIVLTCIAMVFFLIVNRFLSLSFLESKRGGV
jgi:ABC-type spermidine/putrescine transport system permease subunit I